MQGRDGIVCYVSNNSFIDQTTFDGMRKHLLQDFTQIYHLDLHGNVRKNPKLSGTTHNVFGIQVGVGITIAIRTSSNSVKSLYYHRIPEYWNKTEKLRFLAKSSSILGIEWMEIKPDERHSWLVEGIRTEFAIFLPMGSKEARSIHAVETNTIFKHYSLGVSTNRDSVVYDFNHESLERNIKQHIEDYNAEVSRWVREGHIKDVDGFVNYDKVKWSEHLKGELKRERYGKLNSKRIQKSLYRPFCQKWLYYDSLLVDRPAAFNKVFPDACSDCKNEVICLTDIAAEKPFMVIVVNVLPDMHVVGAGANAQTFPYYIYAEDGGNRRENITDWTLAQFRTQYNSELTKRDIFHYVYAMLHHPVYRERYAENLKRDLPHLPLLPQYEAFTTCVHIGKTLMELHLNYETAKEYNLKWIENKDASINWHVEKMKLSSGKDSLKVNEWLTLTGIPQECFQYRLGNRAALEWVIDQYQVSTDARSGIVSDPNQEDDEQYIVRLVRKVVTVSVETVKLVKQLAQAVKQEDWLHEGVSVTSETIETPL